MALTVAYARRVVAHCLTFPLSMLGFSGWRITFGFWCRLTKDQVIQKRELSEVSRVFTMRLTNRVV
jgi:hypothetical protein